MSRGKKVTNQRALRAIFAKKQGRVNIVRKKAGLKRNTPPIPRTYPTDKPKIPVREHLFDKGVNGFFRLPQSIRVRQEVKVAKKLGEAAVVGGLRTIQIKRKRHDPRSSKEAGKDIIKVAGTMEGKRVVGYPRGFSASTKYKMAKRTARK
jgi:hypothetical protein